MLMLNYVSIDKWCKAVKADDLLKYLIGSWKIPALASHYDFINRFLHDGPTMDELFPPQKYSKKVREKLKKDEKWENCTDEDCRSLTQKYWDSAECDSSRVTLIMEKLFREVVVMPSVETGIIDTSGALILNGDGTAWAVHSDAFGHRVIELEVDDPEALTHRYSAKGAVIGWDSHEAIWYLGYSCCTLSCHNPDLSVDLPACVTLRYASVHDALTTISASADFLDLYPELKPDYMCFDSAMDAYAICEWLRHRDIIPIIDWNKRNAESKCPYAAYEQLNENGVPVCKCGIPMVRDGYDRSKMATKYRCPLRMGRIESCEYAQECSPSPYGRVKKVYDKTNYKLFGPVQYKSEKWKDLYKNRTCTERVNKSLLLDNHLQDLGVRYRSKCFFFLVIASMNICLRAWEKCGRSAG